MTFLEQEIRTTVREEVREMVKEEVQRVGISRSAMQQQVAEMARASLEEMGARPSMLQNLRTSLLRSAPGAAQPSERPRVVFLERVFMAGLAVLLAIAAFQGGREYEQYTGKSASAGKPGTSADVSPAGLAEDLKEELAPDTSSWRTTARLYDSLFEQRDQRFVDLLSTMDVAGTSPRLRSAIRAWREGTATAEENDRVHVGLLQLVLRDKLGMPLTVDGETQRLPCAGETCSTLKRVWETAGEGMDLPALTEPLGEDRVRGAERVLVYRQLVVSPP
jgi:hypothetical protein